MWVSTFPGAPWALTRGAWKREQVAKVTGANLVWTVGGGGWYRFGIGQCKYATSAHEGERAPYVKLTDGTTPIWEMEFQNEEGGEHKEGTLNLVSSSYLGEIASSKRPLQMVLPSIFLNSGWKLEIGFVTPVEGDVLGPFTFYAEQFDNGPHGAPIGVHGMSIDDLLQEPLGHAGISA